MTPQLHLLLWPLALWLLIPLPPTSAVDTHGPIIVRGGGGEVGFDPQTGRIVFLRRSGSKDIPGIAQTPPGGDLWTLRLRGGQTVRAGDFLKDRPLTMERYGPQAIRLIYASAQGATVTVDAAGSAAGIDLRLSVKGLADDVLDAAVPDDLSFDPAGLHRVLFPEHLGIALKPSFFEAHAEAVAWDSAPVGPEGLRRVAGVSCRMDPLDAAPVTVRATALGRQTLGADLSAQWEAAPRLVNRPSVPEPDVPLLTSDAGAYLGGHRIGSGLLLRFGGPVRAEDGPLAARTAERLVAALAQSPAAFGLTPQTGRTRVVLILLPHANTGLASEGARLQNSPTLAGAGLQVTIADGPESLRAALGDARTLAVINPYGEQFPAGDDPGAMLDAIHGYLSGGGAWLETGGYSFYYGLRANHFLSLEDHHPSRAFSDFGGIETNTGSVSLYGVQDAHDAHLIFVPSLWRTVGDAAGGHLQRLWQTFLPKTEGGQTPPVRLRVSDRDARAALRAYAKDNGLDRPLAAKMPRRTLELWKRSVMVKLVAGTADEELALLDHLPTPAILHLVAYLHGGFDRQYPDHLPPNPRYGTPEQFRQVIDRAHVRGDLVMPYTNTTWWPDNPKEPTFLAAGDAPLLVRLDGQHNHETYGPGSSGWSITPFHPAVTASVDRLMDQFTREYPVDILFGDQNGARGLMYDVNPASPTPYAYTQGMIDLAARAAAKVPVATEDGFDRLLNAESMFCGLTQELVAFPYTHDTLLKDRLPDADWEFFPMAQYVAHDKAFFIHHDLGAGVADRDALLWTLALGYGMSLSVSPNEAADARKMEWLSYLAQLQRTLGPHYMGAPLTAFRYLRGSGSQGVMEAVYGDMRVVVNLTDRPYRDGPVNVAAHGFSARTGKIVETLPSGLP
ncbi:MAG: hypothetical protein JO250_00015 [Armatimonadetes bacterium]|nr:hypothetical protein [Armatimonadota bacterium]